MIEFLGYVLILVLVIMGVNYWMKNVENENNSINNDFEYYKENSNTFYYETQGLYFRTDLLEIKNKLKQLRHDERVKSEISNSLIKKKAKMTHDAERNLFLFKNLEYLDKCILDVNEEIIREVFFMRLKNCFSSDEKCDNFINKMKKMDLVYERNGILTFSINVRITHPTKLDKQQRQLQIYFSDFKELENKNEWV